MVAATEIDADADLQCVTGGEQRSRLTGALTPQREMMPLAIAKS